MKISSAYKMWKNKESLSLLYFGVGFLEIMAEFQDNIILIYILKPLLIPILAFIYWIRSKQRNNYFFAALFFVFLANIFFISKDFNSIVIASMFSIVNRCLVIYLVLKHVEIKNFLPVFLGSIPFGAAFVYLAFLTMNNLGGGIYIYIIQVLLLVFLGGIALSNYMIEENKKNFWLLLNVVLFAIIQFILVLKLFYLSINIFQPISMLFYVTAQYALYKFMLLSEENATLTKV